MVLFYSVIMASNIALLFKKDDNGFEPLYRRIKEHEKVSKIIVYLYFIFFACFTFPISVTQELSFIFLQLIGYFYLGVCFFGLERENTFKVFREVFALNTIGLIFRIFLEWGEHSMMKGLTIPNVSIFIIVIPCFITLIHRIIIENQESLEEKI